MDPKKATTVKETADGSLALESGFQAGDKLISLEGQPLISVADISGFCINARRLGTLTFEVFAMETPSQFSSLYQRIGKSWGISLGE